MHETPSKTKIYADLMQEVKDRLDVISRAISSLASGCPTHPFAQAELGFLQLRYICELVALATCVAHEPARLSKAILKSWNAERTFALLDEFNGHCFPISVLLNANDDQLHFETVSNSLDARKLKEIYSHCGEMLHRGPLKRLITGEGRVYDVNKLHDWANLIGRSLASHTIVMPDRGAVVIVRLAAGPDRRVEVFEAVSVDGSPFTMTKQTLTNVEPPRAAAES
jgi:hypothetical protein